MFFGPKILQSGNGAGDRNRTRDLTLTKGLLYLLSYTGIDIILIIVNEFSSTTLWYEEANF